MNRTSERLAADATSALTSDIIPFWLRYGIDSEHGGIWTALDQTGRLMESDKSGWFQGRALWTFSRCITDLAAGEADRTTWFAAAAQIHGFLETSCRRDDGRYYFRVTRDGRPLIMRRYIFTEAFAALGNAAFSAAAAQMGAPELSRTAWKSAQQTMAKIDELLEAGALAPKMVPETRTSDGFAVPMILLNLLQEFRRTDPDSAGSYTARIDALVSELDRFIDVEHQCIREQINPDGTFQDHLEGRQLNPGHAIEAAWFILEEARWRRSAGVNGSDRLVRTGLQILDWMWDWGWDAEYGGILYFRDLAGFESFEYWQDMKFWWPHCEAIIAGSLAYHLTGEDRYAQLFDQVYDWTLAHFPDPVHGEWFGYLHRDGTPANHLKGTLFKGPFHIPRMYLMLAAIG